MLSYMMPVEEKSQNVRNLSLNLNLQNTTQSQNSSDTELHDDDHTDENTKLLAMERRRQDSMTSAVKITNGHGILIKNGSSKHHYNMNITNNNLCNLINNNHNNNNSNNNNNNSIIKNGVDTDISCEQKDDTETDTGSVATSTDNATNNNNNDNSQCSTGNSDKRLIKMTKLGSKNVTLKRVSFGSSKGSMVETLVFETPTPLPEHAEREFFPTSNPAARETTNENGELNDSGIELQQQEELERSKVRVTFFQSSQPQQVSPPIGDNQFYFGGDNYFNNNSLIDSFLNPTNDSICNMTTVDGQISTDSGWDNPFRPDGDLSREADEIVNLIKGGKPITPTGDFNHLVNGTHDLHQESNGTTVADGATKLEASPLLAQQQQPQNSTKSPKKETSNGEAMKDQLVEPKVSSQTVPGPQSATQVVIDEKKKKGGKCCVIQ